MSISDSIKQIKIYKLDDNLFENKQSEGKEPKLKSKERLWGL